jgi:hypothetical protein
VFHHFVEDPLHHVGVDQVALGFHHFLNLHSATSVAGAPCTSRK